jgi:hypothetical protein
MTAKEQLDTIMLAEAAVGAANRVEKEAAAAHRAAKKAVATAKERLASALRSVREESRQPSLPFDVRTAADAPSVPQKPWRELGLAEAGFTAGESAWEVHVAVAVVNAGVAACGELADRLLAGDRFGLADADLDGLFAAVEMLSEDDEAPIDFDNALAAWSIVAPEPQPRKRKVATK